MKHSKFKAIAQLVVAVPLLGPNVAQAADQPSGASGVVRLAQLSPAEIEARKKAEQNKQRPAPQQPQQRPAMQPPQQRPQGPPTGGRPPSTEGMRRPAQPPQQQRPQINPQQANPSTPPGQQRPFVRPVVPPAAPKAATPSTPPGPPPMPKAAVPSNAAPAAKMAPGIQPKVVPPGQPQAMPGRPAGGIPEGMPRPNPTTGARPGMPPVGAAGRPGAVPFAPKPMPSAQPASAAPQFKQLQEGRQTRQEDGGRRTVIQEGNRTIVKQDNRVFIRHDEGERFRNLQGARSVRMPNGVQQTYYVRPDGFRVVSETDRNGNLLRRFRRGPDGREFMIVDNRRFWRRVGIGVGIGALATIVALNMRPPVVTIPRERYIVDYDRASDDVIYETLMAPPVEPLDRVYSLEEVRYNVELRDRVRRIDLDTITFDFGSYIVGPEQYSKLERLAHSINRVLSENPDAVFLIEGHTDAVGNAEDNLSLSDRRAQSVAQILTEQFGVPPENLTTQGYGEQYLKVPTQEAERANRRVAVRNITRLVAEGPR